MDKKKRTGKNIVLSIFGVIAICLIVLILFQKVTPKEKKVIHDKPITSVQQGNLPSAGEMYNTKYMYGFLRGFIGENNNFTFNKDNTTGGYVYAIDNNKKNVYASVYQPKESFFYYGEPIFGSQPRYICKKGTIHEGIELMKNQYPKYVKNEKGWTILLIPYNQKKMIDNLINHNLNVKSLSNFDWKDSYYQHNLRSGYGVPTKIMRKEPYKSLLSKYDKIDINDKIFNKYNLDSVSQYTDKEGKSYSVEVSTSKNEPGFKCTTPDFEYKFANTLNSSAESQMKNFIKSNKLTLKSGPDFLKK